MLSRLNHSINGSLSNSSSYFCKLFVR
ncbi:protein of unknown function [Methylorubrum extorquens]|uniref:Uncharacterized protein n=1 Tax=Methylorubrum extorquens TaxID=408 RepID=A0A2N9AWQ7_METEX|nr:protein of unknown function [Methylorubrum extorquens]